jgi:tetratricopeptide (TPR) repeat protein
LPIGRLKNYFLSGFTSGLAFIVLFILFLTCGCGVDGSKSIVFNAEKLYRSAEKLNEKSLIKPELIDETLKNSIKDAYYQVTNYCWKNIDSLPITKFPDERRDLESIGFLATNRLIQIFNTEDKFDSVIFIIRQLQNFTNLNGKPLLSARLSLARAFQARGDWSDAMNIYRSLIDTFYPPVDNNNEIIFRIINLPLEIIRIYNLLGNVQEVATQSQSAEDYYKQLIREWPNSSLETAARSNLARLYHNQKKWDKSIENLKLIKDSTGAVNLEAALMIAGITVTGKKDYKTAIGMYDELLGRVEDSALFPVIIMRKGIVLYENEDYDDCRELMAQINDDYPAFYQNNPLPQKYSAQCFEKLGDWDRAENEFRWLIDNYSTTEAAFNAHLTIVDHYENENSRDFAQNWYQRSEDFYNRMAGRYSGTAIEASAISYLAEIAKRRQEWDKSAKFLENIYAKFPKSSIGQQSIANAATIYRDKLNNPNKADSLISDLKTELYPDKGGKNINIITENNN